MVHTCGPYDMDIQYIQASKYSVSKFQYYMVDIVDFLRLNVYRFRDLLIKRENSTLQNIKKYIKTII